jgi:hypothetical protein
MVLLRLRVAAALLRVSLFAVLVVGINRHD